MKAQNKGGHFSTTEANSFEGDTNTFIHDDIITTKQALVDAFFYVQQTRKRFGSEIHPKGPFQVLVLPCPVLYSTRYK